MGYLFKKIIIKVSYFVSKSGSFLTLIHKKLCRKQSLMRSQCILSALGKKRLFVLKKGDVGKALVNFAPSKPGYFF